MQRKQKILLFILSLLSINWMGCDSDFGFIASFQKPCPGNPVNVVTVAPTPVSGLKGGTYGCARQGDNDCRDGIYDKWHDGIDIKSRRGAPLFSMYDGQVIDQRNSFLPGQYKANSFGNFVSVRSILSGGNEIILKYNHLERVITRNGRRVKSGDIIALTGNTGNAASPEVIPHIHIQAFDMFGNTMDPRNFLATKIDEIGRVIDQCRP